MDGELTQSNVVNNSYWANCTSYTATSSNRPSNPPKTRSPERELQECKYNESRENVEKMY
jgi:hypothetical protein